MSKNPTLNLPVICTRGVVVFPGQDVMVEVGRPKSINAVEESSNSYDNMVFITCQKDIMVEDPKVDDVYSIGTLSKIKVIRRKDGFMRVTFTGMKRARMISLEDSKHMMVATIEPLDEIQGDSLQEAAYVKKIIDEFRKFGNLSAAFPSDVLNSLTQGISAITLTDQFAQFFPFDIAVKQQLLEELNLNERMLIIINELEKQLKMNEIEADINDKVQESIDGSQKEYYLREKLKAIKEELGDVSNFSDDTQELRDKIENNPYPEHVKQKAREERKRYEMSPQGSGEASVARNYLEWLLNVPWYETTEDNSDLKEVQSILDEDHYGLKKVKERIMLLNR